MGPHVHAEGGGAAVLLAADAARLGWAGVSSDWPGLDCQVEGLTLLRWPAAGGRGGGGPVGGGGAAASTVQSGGH